MFRYCVYYLLCLIFSVSYVYAAKVRLKVEGLSGTLQQNVQVTLSTIEDDEVSADGRFKTRVDDSIRQGLRALGYYEPTITFEFQPKKPPARPVMRVHVTPGEPVKVAAVNVVIAGEAKDDKDYQALLKRAEGNVGKTLIHSQYDALKSGLTGLAWRKGFFDAEISKSQLGVIKASRLSFWDIDFDSGQRYRFGKVSFSGSQIREDYLQHLQPFQEGDYYHADQLGEFNRRLSETGWFNSVVVTPDFTGVGDDKVLSMSGVVTPRIRNTLETGIGYSTDIGPRIKGSWKKPWLNSRGHSLGSTLSLSGPEQSIDLSYKMPMLKDPLEEYYLLQAGVKRHNLNDTKDDAFTVNLARYWDLSSGWQRVINMRWIYDHFTQADETKHTMLLYPGISMRKTRQYGGLMPSWGDTQNYSVDVSSGMWGSDVNFAVLQAQNVWVRSLAKKHRFVLRTNLGWIETEHFSRIPPSLRFFAGGDRSIRGYKYKSISPKDSDGKLLGASKQVTGSLEYQYNVTDSWWGAMFVDSGEAVSSLHDQEIKTGLGLGVRWASPVGPVKLDFALPVNDREHHGVQFYIGLGPEL